jgi:hypothetical protein
VKNREGKREGRTNEDESKEKNKKQSEGKKTQIFYTVFQISYHLVLIEECKGRCK